jgi:crossover junction endodeoxyribonuclease RusA
MSASETSRRAGDDLTRLGGATTSERAQGTGAPEAPARTWTIALPPGTKLLNANERLHHMARARRVATIRETAGWVAKAANVPRLEQVAIVAEIRPSSRRKQDAHNQLLAVKAAIDGALTDAGICADDDNEHLVSVAIVDGPVIAGGQLLLHITEVTTENGTPHA